MAKKKEEEKIDFNALDEKSQKKAIDAAFKQLDGFSDMCTWLSDAQSNIESFDDTGCYILNALASGDFRGGFPEGRMSLLAAESSVGKSYIALRTAALAQAKGKYVLIFDSEYAIDNEFARNLGVDVSKAKYFPVKTIEQARNSIYAFLKHVIDNGMQGKFFIIVDSLANMISDLDMSRADKDSAAADMGTRARAMKSFLQMCITMSGQSKTTILCTNHVYDNPGAMFTSLVKNQPGGKCVTYLPSTVIQLSAVNVKEGDDRKIDDQTAAGGKGLVGKAITGLSIKNRVCKPFMTADMYISWEKGLSKYYGLLELALEFKLIYNRAGRYYFEEDALNERYLREQKGATDSTLPDMYEKMIGTRKELIKDEDFWEHYLDYLQIALSKHWKYSIHDDKKKIESEAQSQIDSIFKSAIGQQDTDSEAE